MSADRIDFNSALESVGSFGLYQKLLCVLLVVPSAAFSALTYFTQFFIIMVPDHWCDVPLPQDYNGSVNSFKSIIIPREYRNGLYEYSQCRFYDVNGSQMWQNTSGVDWPVSDCRGQWKFDFSSLYPTIATELNWVCDRDRLPYWSQTIFYIGTSVGTFVLGHVADRYGRKPSILLSYLIACCAGIASSFARSFAAFSVLRFFVGACIIPLSEDPYVLSLEYIGVERRTLPIVFWSLGYVAFSAICPWIAYGLRDWQLLSIITAAPLILMVLAAKFIPESASWLMTRGRHGDMLSELQRVARINGRVFPAHLKSAVLEDDSASENTEKRLTLLDLLKTPRLRKHTLILAASWFITYCCYHTNTQNTSNLSTDIYKSFTYGALVEAPVLVFILFGLDRFGRRWPMIFALILAGLAGILAVAIPKDTPQILLAVGLLQRLGITANYNIIMQYSAEVYPTVLRGRGLAFLRLMGTLGLYLSPSLVYLALENQALPLLTSGIMALALAVLTLPLPETLHQHLPHTLDEAEQFGKDQKILDCPCIKRMNYEHSTGDGLN